MEFEDTRQPDVKKPLIIAAMQDMGNVGSIVVNFINKSLAFLIILLYSSAAEHFA